MSFAGPNDQAMVTLAFSQKKKDVNGRAVGLGVLCQRPSSFGSWGAQFSITDELLAENLLRALDVSTQ